MRDGVMGMGFGGVLLDREDAVVVVDRRRMTSIKGVMTVGYNFLGWYHNGMFTPSGWSSMTSVG